MHATVDRNPPLPESILRGRDMLCFSHDWTGDPLSKTHVMRILSRHNRILWINSIGYRTPSVVSKADMSRAFKKIAAVMTKRMREVEPNIFVLNPLAVPIYGPVGQRLNRWLLRMQVRRAMRRLQFRSPINWVFNPAAAVVAGHLAEERVIYYCVDEYTAFSGVASRTVAELEQRLLRRADLVIVSAERLYESKAPMNPRTVLVRHGVDFDHFRKAIDPATQIPDDIAAIPRPIIGFFGLIADWVDVDVMAAIARHFSAASMVVLGKATTDVSKLAALPNVHLLGRKPYAQLPAYCRAFDVAINPFRVNELTLNTNPLKVREYLAAGLPVVSTDIPEVRVLNACRLASDADGFIKQIAEALQDPGPSPHRSNRIRHESWESRVDEIADHLGQLPQNRNKSVRVGSEIAV